MSLNITPIHKNLHTRVTFLGLEFEDMLTVLLLAIVLNLAAHFVSDQAKVIGIPLNIFIEFVVPLMAVPFPMVFKYGKPRGYLQDLVKSFLAPRAWCALEPDSELTRPYMREAGDEDDTEI
jgi:hypothetical protein